MGEYQKRLIFLFAWPGYELNTLALLLKLMNAASVRNARVLSVLLTNAKELKMNLSKKLALVVSAVTMVAATAGCATKGCCGAKGCSAYSKKGCCGAKKGCCAAQKGCCGAKK